MTQTLIKENIEDVKLRKQLKIIKADALLEMVKALIRNQERKEIILADAL